MKIFFLFMCLMVACNPNVCPTWGYANQSRYSISSDSITPMGIQVDSSGQSVDLNKIDNIILKVQECLWKNFENGIPYDVMKTGDCIVDHIDFPLNLSCATIKVVNDWQWSCDGKWQLLGESATAPQELCSSKGLSPDPNCPCRWRAGLQDGNIVVTPDLRMLADPLIRLATGCNNPWGHTLLSMCAQVNIVE